MKRINNCEFKESFPWIWDRFDRVIITKFDELSTNVRLDDLYDITIISYGFTIFDISNRVIYGTISIDLFKSSKLVIDKFLRSILLNKDLTNKERFNCICSFADLGHLKHSIKDKVKDFFYPSFSIEMNKTNNTLEMFIRIGDAGTLSTLLDPSGLVLCYEFETDNYEISWVNEAGSVKLKQFYQNLNSLLLQEANKLQNEVQ